MSFFLKKNVAVEIVHYSVEVFIAFPMKF